MEQKSGGIGKWLLFGLAIFLLIQFGWPLLFGKGDAPATQPFSAEHYGTVPEGDRPEEQLCELRGDRSAVVLSSRGGSLKSAKMLDPQYAHVELVTSSKEQRMPLRASLRAVDAPADQQQVDTDNLDFVLEASDGRSCTFAHKGPKAEITRVVSLTDRPFELDVKTTVKNVSDAPKKHRFSAEQTSWRTAKETESSFWDLGRRPEWLTEVVTHSSSGTERHYPDAFAPDEFSEEGFTNENWLRAKGAGVWSGVSTNYFTQTVIHRTPSVSAASETLIEDGTYYNLKPGDPNYGHLYRARVAYDAKELGPGEEITYDVLAFIGPKEREVLALVGGAEGGKDKHKTTELIDLGMFGIIGAQLVAYTNWLHKLVGSWGWAICLLTLTVKLLVFPLQLPQLKTSVAMRRVKPAVDEINEKYKDDMMQKNLALQELYRREGIRPLIGCLPLLLQMPVWISLYQALLTAVELYRVPFGPLIPDLSVADPYHVIPIVLGGSSFLQQKLMPAQGMDPAQQKMMLYMMPAIFTVMMFFLPAGLGVYMLTNTWLGIIQQVLVERWMQSKLKPASSIEVREKKKADAPALKPAS